MTSVAEALRGLKIAPREIASRSNLPLERVEQLLKGARAALTELRAISTGLRVPMHVLAEGKRPSEGGRVEPLFRSIRGAHEDFDVTVERVATFVNAALELLPERQQLPAWLMEFSPKEVTYAEADRLAKRFREIMFEHPEDDAAFDLPTRLGRLDGVIISRLLFSRYEGVSLIAGNYCFIFVSPRFQGRMLFTIGHELGHLIAHHRDADEARFERPAQIGSFGGGSRAEAFVDAFSSCLLLPDVGVGRAIKAFREYYRIEDPKLTDYEILLLARFYGVSFDVAAKRCEDLGLLPPGVAFALSDRIRKEFRSAEKRADALGVPPRQKIEIPPISAQLALAISRAINAGSASIGWVTDRLGVSIGEVFAINAESASS